MRACFQVVAVAWKWLAVAIVLLGANATVHGAERRLEIEAPEVAKPNQDVAVTITASTDAAGEQVGFLQVETSVDGGKTWTAVCYLDQCGPRVQQGAWIKSGEVGSVLQLRARAAFRDGLAGDVDYRGAALMWQGSWKHWESPPSRYAEIRVSEE